MQLFILYVYIFFTELLTDLFFICYSLTEIVLFYLLNSAYIKFKETTMKKTISTLLCLIIFSIPQLSYAEDNEILAVNNPSTELEILPFEDVSYQVEPMASAPKGFYSYFLSGHWTTTYDGKN